MYMVLLHHCPSGMTRPARKQSSSANCRYLKHGVHVHGGRNGCRISWSRYFFPVADCARQDIVNAEHALGKVGHVVNCGLTVGDVLTVPLGVCHMASITCAVEVNLSNRATNACGGCY
jgi:hypothetical protein